MADSGKDGHTRRPSNWSHWPLHLSIPAIRENLSRIDRWMASLLRGVTSIGLFGTGLGHHFCGPRAVPTRHKWEM